MLRCGVVLWSSRPPAFARLAARSHRGFGLFGLGLPSLTRFVLNRDAFYAMVDWVAVDALTNLLRVGRPAASLVVVVWSAVGVLVDVLRVVLEGPVSAVVVLSAVGVLTKTSRLRGGRGALVSVVTILYGVRVLSMA